MSYVYLILSVFMNASTSIFGKFYSRKNMGEADPVPLYNFLVLLSVFIGWCILFAYNFSFDVAVLPYSLLFAVSYTVCNLGIIYALKYGPASLTSLFLSLSLLVTTIWGFIFWNVKLTPVVIFGLVLVSLSVFLCLNVKKDDKKISFKWLIFVLLALLGNAGCSIIQRTEQMNFGGKHGEMLMVFSSFISLAVFFVVFMIKGRTNAKMLIKKSWYLPVSAGICNIALNVFVILLATSELSPSLIYPTIGVGGLIVVILFSLFVFKERLKPSQWIGILIGGFATILLSL